MQNLLSNPIEEQIAEQMALEKGPKLKPVPPLQTPVIAKQHTPVYQMHRYFARRPWNVFEHIIKHYTNPGDLILDPFCGGGVTVYEGLKLRRRVIGVDLNPLAAWITKIQVEPADLEEVEKAFAEVEKEFAPIAMELYSTNCEECGKEAQAEWFEWSNVHICPSCGEKVILGLTKKLRGGIYECSNTDCINVIKPLECERVSDTLIRKKVNCPDCGNKIQIINRAHPDNG